MRSIKLRFWIAVASLAFGVFVILMVGPSGNDALHRKDDGTALEEEEGGELSRLEAFKRDREKVLDRGAEAASDQSEPALLPPRLGEKRISDIPGMTSNILFNISGNRAVSDQEIIEALQLPEKPSLKQLERLVSQQIRSFYKSRGFAQAWTRKVTATGANPVVVDVVLQEGLPFLFGELKVLGVSRFSIEEVRSLYPKPGETLNLQACSFADSLLQKRYHDSGFLDAKVIPRTEILSASTQVNYSVQVEEGKQYRVGSIDISSMLKDHFPFGEGDVFLPGVLEDLRRSANLRKDKIVVDKDPTRGQVDITIFD